MYISTKEVVSEFTRIDDISDTPSILRYNAKLTCQNMKCELPVLGDMPTFMRFGEYMDAGKIILYFLLI